MLKIYEINLHSCCWISWRLRMIRIWAENPHIRSVVSLFRIRTMYWYTCRTFSKSYLHVKGTALIQCINSILTLLPSPNVIEVVQWWPLLNEFFWHCSKPGIAETLSFQLTHSGTKTHIHLLQHIIPISEWLRFRFSRILKRWVQLSTPYSMNIYKVWDSNWVFAWDSNPNSSQRL